MATPYLGEIKLFAGTFAPRGFAFCDGQLLAISQNDALFSLLGTTYGGDGRTTFALPELRGRVPIHQGQGPGLTKRVLGQRGGVERASVNVAQLPVHGHRLQGSGTAADDTQPAGKVLAKATADIYIEGEPDVDMAPQAISATGGGQTHANLQPSLCINYIIALDGIYPTRT